MRTDIDSCKEQIILKLQQGIPQAQIARELNCKIDTLKSRLFQWGVSDLKNPSRKGLDHSDQIKPAEEYLKPNFKTNTHRLRVKLIREGIKEAKCEGCSNTHWLGKPIQLELDHVNGDRLDNRLENLRILCPNCHSQTPTYKTKNRKHPDVSQTV